MCINKKFISYQSFVGITTCCLLLRTCCLMLRACCLAQMFVSVACSYGLAGLQWPDATSAPDRSGLQRRPVLQEPPRGPVRGTRRSCTRRRAVLHEVLVVLQDMLVVLQAVPGGPAGGPAGVPAGGLQEAQGGRTRGAGRSCRGKCQK